MHKLGRRLHGAGFARWINTHPLQAATAACAVSVLLATALGAWTRSTFLQNAAANLVGGIVAAIVVFSMADVAFGFSQTRKREQEAVRVAVGLLGLELFDNIGELDRIIQVLRDGELKRSDPVVQPQGALQTQSWQLLVQSPMAANLPSDLVWSIHQAYYIPERLQRLVRARTLGAALSPLARARLCREFLPKFEEARRIVHAAILDLNTAYRP
ncbi:MAG TPA: hypothetical protein VM537_29505 [Anaerolineae bacterium]|nr:hypothetical protein [Anaerolineae bacterium]